jgi:hypothetical protein
MLSWIAFFPCNNTKHSKTDNSDNIYYYTKRPDYIKQCNYITLLSTLIFIYDLFNNVCNSSSYIASNDRMNRK